MRFVLDTNVFVSGVFFGGHPYRILNAWRESRFTLVLSVEILDEYCAVRFSLGPVETLPHLRLAEHKLMIEYF